MFCKNCGRQIPDDATFCPGCGTKRPSGSDTYGEGRSNSDMKNLPSYAKENDLRKSGAVIDSERKKFSLTGDGHKSFSLSDGAGRKPFSLTSKPADEPKRDDGFVRANAVSATPAPPPSAPPPPPAMKPAPEMSKTPPAPVFSKPAEPPPAQTVETAPQDNAEPTGFVNPLKGQNQEIHWGAEQDAGQDAGPTGFVNPLKEQDREIHWGSDGDRNEQNGKKGAIDPDTINSHMGFAVFCTLCCCLPTGIAAIVFASQVSKHIKDGDYEQAQHSADTAQMLCWISVGLYFLCSLFSGVLSALTNVLSITTTP